MGFGLLYASLSGKDERESPEPQERRGPGWKRETWCMRHVGPSRSLTAVTVTVTSGLNLDATLR
jgi:hypothetical protein